MWGRSRRRWWLSIWRGFGTLGSLPHCLESGMDISIAWWLQVIEHGENARDGVWRYTRRLLITIDCGEISIKCITLKFAASRSTRRLQETDRYVPAQGFPWGKL